MVYGVKVDVTGREDVKAKPWISLPYCEVMF